MSALVTFYWSPRAWGDLRLRVSAFSPDLIGVVTDLVVESAPAPLVTVQGSRSMRAIRMRAFRRENGVMAREPTSLLMGHYWRRAFGDWRLAFGGDESRRIALLDAQHPTTEATAEMRRVARELWPAIGKLAPARLIHATRAFFYAWGDGPTEAALNLARTAFVESTRFGERAACEVRS